MYTKEWRGALGGFILGSLVHFHYWECLLFVNKLSSFLNKKNEHGYKTWVNFTAVIDNSRGLTRNSADRSLNSTYPSNMPN